MTKADIQLTQPTSPGLIRQLFGDWAAVGKFLSVAIQFGLLVLVVRQFQLENQAFYDKIMPLAFGGFLIHYFLPQRYRLFFFVVLSVVGIYAALGFPNSLWLIGIGLLLIGICHLPAPFAVRLALLIGSAVVLVLIRINQIKVSWAGAVLPILASMFMFRLMIYLYDLKHQKAKFSFQHTLAYFFMLPNLVFPLFPVVDYSTFCRTYYDSDRHQIYQKGINLMLLGIIQLMLYRYLYYYWTIAPEDVRSLSNLAQFIAVNYLLILWLVGLFTLVVGMLHLFGFNLPKPMQRFFLAPNFTEYWRQANVYWKDFVQKVFFYPIYFKLRKSDATTRLLIAMVIVFICTWFFHAYQWFWIRGSFLLTAPDISYWTLLGVCVISNAVYESKHGRQRTLGQTALTFSELAMRALRATGLFIVIGVLWSLWTSSSMAEWFSLWSNASPTLDEVLKLIAGLLLTFAAFLVAMFLFERTPQPATTKSETVPFFRSAAMAGALIIFLFLLGKPIVLSQLKGRTLEVLRDLQTARLNRQEAELLTRGYYENLNAANQFNSKLWELEMKKPDNWPTLRETPAGRATGDFLRDEIVPSARIVFHGAPLSTNRWGMRDKEYEKKKPDNTYRIVLLGASISFGSGVADNETFEWILEERLNKASNGGKYANYEILNFSAPGYSPLQELVVFENKVLDFAPDALFYMASPREDISSARHLMAAARNGVAIPYDYLQEIVQKAKINAKITEAEAMKRFDLSEELLAWLYPRFAEICRQHNILPVYIYTPVLQKVENDPVKEARFMGFAREAGFKIIDISDAYENHDTDLLRVAEWDWHPNAEGHRLLADRLYKALRDNQEILGLALK